MAHIANLRKARVTSIVIFDLINLIIHLNRCLGRSKFYPFNLMVNTSTIYVFSDIRGNIKVFRNNELPKIEGCLYCNIWFGKFGY